MILATVAAATVSWQDIVFMGGALGIFGGVKMVHGKLTNGKKTNGCVKQEVCDERHKQIETFRSETREDFKTVFGKLDTINEHLLERR